MGKTIMVVDDEADIRETVKAVLEKEGYTVVTAVNADDALKKEATAKPALILMDIMMPGISGQQVMDRVKIERPELPVVMLTAVAGSGSEAEFRQRGAADYMRKPCSMETVVATAVRVLQSRK